MRPPTFVCKSGGMMPESSLSCLGSSRNQVRPQGLHTWDNLSFLSRSGKSFTHSNGGDFWIRRVVCSSTSRCEISKAVTLPQSPHSRASRRARETSTTSALSGHSHGALDLHTHGQSAVYELEVPFLDRLNEAWRVLVGAPQETIMKDRFSRLLTRDRGFNPTNLSRLYNAAREAILQHVELEDEDLEVKANAQQLGEVQLYFKVRRLRSNHFEETYNEETDVDFHPQIEPHLLWQESLPRIESNGEQNQVVDQSIVSPLMSRSTSCTNLLEEDKQMEGFSPMVTGIHQRWQGGASDRPKASVFE